ARQKVLADHHRGKPARLGDAHLLDQVPEFRTEIGALPPLGVHEETELHRLFPPTRTLTSPRDQHIPPFDDTIDSMRQAIVRRSVDDLEAGDVSARGHDLPAV